MNSVNSDESISQKDLSAVNLEEHDLYKYIPPPIPLIPKNKYSDDLPRSYFMML
jgi:hypothetical protein